MTTQIKFAKLNKDAKIPSKEKGNVGYDIYACFPERTKVIRPHETLMIPTGICSIIPEGYAMILKDRGSTGSKGIHTACGVVDSSYRGEWFVAIHNDTKDTLYITKEKESDFKDKLIYGMIIYPYEKAIAQAILIEDLDSEIQEVDIKEIKENKTKRGQGKVGSSGK